jgi:hypothetical protein
LNFHHLKIVSVCLALVITGCSENDAPASKAAVTEAVKAAAADTIFQNGRVYTVNSKNDIVEAIAIKDGKIIAVGSDKQLAALVGKSTKVIDLNGRMLMPGLVDAHMHPMGAGAQLTGCSLGNLSLTEEQVLSMITACLEKEKDAPADHWLQVSGWFRQAMKPEGTDLTAAILDRLPTDRPVVVTASDHHTLAANTRAMQLAGITRDTQDPSDGKIVRNEREATGIFLDGAMGIVAGAVPPLSETEQHAKNLADLEVVLKALGAEGVTTIFDAAASEGGMAAFLQKHNEGQLTVRAQLAPVVSVDAAQNPKEVVAHIKELATRFNTPREALAPGIRIKTAKMFVDGVIQKPAQTGATLQPYLHNVGTPEHPNWQPSDKNGALYFDQPVLSALLDELAANHINAHMHTTGDKAVNVALNAIAGVRAKYGNTDFRPSLAHDELVDPGDYQRFAELNATPVLSLQWGKPAPDTIDSVKNYIGPKRFPYLETAGKFHEAGVRIAFGSDWPVDPLNEWLAMQVAITRTNPNATDPKYQGRLGDDPGLDLKTTLRAMTLNAAYTMNMDQYVGSLEVGKFADLIVIDQDLTAIAPEKIADTQVLLTLVGGREVYRAPSFSTP